MRRGLLNFVVPFICIAQATFKAVPMTDIPGG